MMLLRARDNNIQSFAYIWLYKGNQNEFLKHPKIKWLDGGLYLFNFGMLKEFVLISFMKPDERKTLNNNFTAINNFYKIVTINSQFFKCNIWIITTTTTEISQYSYKYYKLIKFEKLH